MCPLQVVAATCRVSYRVIHQVGAISMDFDFVEIIGEPQARARTVSERANAPVGHPRLVNGVPLKAPPEAR